MAASLEAAGARGHVLWTSRYSGADKEAVRRTVALRAFFVDGALRRGDWLVPPRSPAGRRPLAQNSSLVIPARIGPRGLRRLRGPPRPARHPRRRARRRRRAGRRGALRRMDGSRRGRRRARGHPAPRRVALRGVPPELRAPPQAQGRRVPLPARGDRRSARARRRRGRRPAGLLYRLPLQVARRPRRPPPRPRRRQARAPRVPRPRKTRSRRRDRGAPRASRRARRRRRGESGTRRRLLRRALRRRRPPRPSGLPQGPPAGAATPREPRALLRGRRRRPPRRPRPPPPAAGPAEDRGDLAEVTGCYSWPSPFLRPSRAPRP